MTRSGLSWASAGTPLGLTAFQNGSPFTLRALIETYGSVDQWQRNFQAIGGMRGIGWVILYEDPADGRLVNQWISLHQDGVPARWKPILVMDVWEHAFMRDYKATERSKYVDAFLKNIDWATVDQRLRETAPRAA